MQSGCSQRPVPQHGVSDSSMLVLALMCRRRTEVRVTRAYVNMILSGRSALCVTALCVVARCFSHVERCSHGFRRSFPICASACRCAPTAAHAVNDGAFEAPTLLTNTHIFQRDILARVLTIHQLAVQLPSVESRQFVNSTGCEAQVCIHPVRHLHYKGNGPKPKQSNGCKTSVRVLGACKCMVL